MGDERDKDFAAAVGYWSSGTESTAPSFDVEIDDGKEKISAAAMCT